MIPFIGQIQQFGFNFAPRGWAFCNGQMLPIAQNTALFSLLGTIYGGDGRTTFGLPNFQSRAAIGYGRGPGLSDYRQGSMSGLEEVEITVAEMPAHNHIANIVAEAPNTSKPADQLIASPDPTIYSDQPNPDAILKSTTIGNTGGGQKHNNMQPYLTINWCIALTGVYPSRS